MRIYRPQDLRDLGIDYSQQHLRRLERAGKFPRRFKLAEGAAKNGHVGWPADEIDEHLRRRADSRTVAAGDSPPAAAEAAEAGAVV